MKSNEVWVDIDNYNGLYQISNLGRVKSIQGRYSGLILTPHKTTKGYYRLALRKNKISKKYLIHRLVAEAFIPNPNNYLIINHIDENKINNQYKNLEWCTQKHNVNHGNGIYKCAMKKWKAVIQYTLSGEFVRKYSSIKEASIINKLSQSHIGDCCKGRIKTHGGYKWRLEND